MKTKIAFISEHASPLAQPGSVDCGGQNVYVAEVARQLARMDYQVDVFTRKDSPELPPVVHWLPGVRVIYVEAGPCSFIPKEQMLGLMDEFANRVIEFCRAQTTPYAMVHAHFFMSAMVASAIKKHCKIPYVITFHALGRVRRIYQKEKDLFPDERLAIEEELMKDADLVIAECPQDSYDMQRLYNADANKVTIVPCGFNPEEFYPIDQTTARRMLGLVSDEAILLHIGRIVARKGIDNIIKAMPLIQSDRKVRLLIVGGSKDDATDPEMLRLKNLVRQLNLCNDIVFTGNQPRHILKYYYSAADVFITTPWYEPFGITPLEAMACGTPVIGARVGGIKYSVIDQKCGLLVPPDQPAALADAVKKVLPDEQLRQQMQRQALYRANSFFKWEAVAKKLHLIYTRLCAADRASSYDSQVA
ncbi:MAG: glycosyltransferase [Agriterribacter sp.]